MVEGTSSKKKVDVVEPTAAIGKITQDITDSIVSAVGGLLPKDQKAEEEKERQRVLAEKAASQADTDVPDKEDKPKPGSSQKFIMEAFEERPSILSSDNKDNNYRGFINVCIVLLVLAKFEDMLRNAYKYGPLMKLSMFTGALSDFDASYWPNVTIGASLSVFAANAYLLEVGMSSVLPASVLLFLQICNSIAAFVLPASAVWVFSNNPGGATVTLLFATVTMMKLWSFAMVCPTLRKEAKSKDKAYRPSVAHFAYFMLIPTMIFSRSYPQSPRVRRRWVMSRMVEMALIWFGIIFVAVQYIMPGLRNTLVTLEDPNIIQLAEGLVKIAVPNFVVWILGFYAIFHLQLNIIAELLCFGDRQFYRDWWNATTVEYFWKSWNLPVHQWMVAHVYLPMVRNNIAGKQLASLTCFTLSAIFHEIIVSIPFRNFKMLAFGGMMAQVLLIELTKPLKGKQVGNVIFWLSIILGQPLIVLLYFRDHIKGMSGPWTQADSQFYSKLLGL